MGGWVGAGVQMASEGLLPTLRGNSIVEKYMVTAHQ